MIERANRAGDELIERLRGQHPNAQDYIAALERHVREGLRVNVGLMVEAEKAKRKGQK